MKRSTIVFIVAALVWEVVVALMYGLFIRYNQTAFASMNTITNQYYFADDSTSLKMYTANTTEMPFPMMVVTLAMILILVGLALVSAYVERSGITNMALTLLLFALTIQNFFIFRDFFDRASINDPNASKDFTTRYYQKINYINFGNTRSTYTYTSSSLLEAVGATLALYAGYSAVMGCIGLGEIFFLSLIGTFLYELNSQLLWRLYIPDNGWPSRAFGFGGALGLVSSLIFSKKQLTENNPNYQSTYHLRTLSFLGAIIVWCTYPILITTDLYNSVQSQIVAMSAQVNIWMSLAGSAIGCFTASMYIYRKFCVHDLVFSAISGAIAFSSSTDLNYNPGAALTLSSIVGLLCTLCQTELKRRINRKGVIDSNGMIFQFLLPSFFAAVFSAILAGIGESAATAFILNNNTTGTATFATNKDIDRGNSAQGGYQMAGWFISVGIGAVAGALVGLFYYFIDTRSRPEECFSDLAIFSQPKENYDDGAQTAPPTSTVK